MCQLYASRTRSHLQMAMIGICNSIITAHWAIVVATNQFLAHGVFRCTILETDHCDELVTCQGKPKAKVRNQGIDHRVLYNLDSEVEHQLEFPVFHENSLIIKFEIRAHNRFRDFIF